MTIATIMMSTQPIPLDDDQRWSVVAERNEAYDGMFVYAVRSTGIYCRPSCPSRRPQRNRVAFFGTPDAAEQAGFRPCLRCVPRDANPPDPMIGPVTAACAFIADHLDERLTLETIGAAVAVSPQHLQRNFTRLVGVSPRAYADALRQRKLREQLRNGREVLPALDEAGYGSSSRVYERGGERLGMTPTAFRNGGKGMQISYGIARCPLGLLLTAATERGVCAVSLGDDEAALMQELQVDYPAAEITRDDDGLGTYTTAIVAYLEGTQPSLDLPLDVQATAFQRQVWEQLRAIPYGETRTYAQIAEALDKPGAARAVGRACATNPVSLIVPCHRAVGSDGKLHGFRWGLARKQALLELERR